MTIWELIPNEGYNNAILVDDEGNQCHDSGYDYLEKQNDPAVREIKIEKHRKGFPDIMNYWGVPGTCIVNNRTKELIERNFGDLAIQFFPCQCKQFPDIEMWVLNVYEYHDVFDVDNSVFQTLINHKGEKKICYINKFAFTNEAFDLDLFKIYIDGYKNNIRLYVSDHFKTFMEETEVTGLAFKKVYSV